MDKHENKSLNDLQESLKRKLDFSASNLYAPKTGDCLLTLDALYKNGIASVGIDITQYPATPIHTEQYITTVTGNYVPGYFSFYEGPVLLDTLLYLAGKQILPDLIIADGHGLAHPRQFGLACYIGAHTGLPVIGIAKESLLPFDKSILGPEQYAAHNFEEQGHPTGVAIRLQKGRNPVYISAGNRISLPTAIDLIKQLSSDFKYPDNMRRADAASRIHAQKS
ncbi:MAG: endonuclease V [Bacteroidetes bacterium]|nr:endonuclease V [Bacteroidota bacterium]